MVVLGGGVVCRAFLGSLVEWSVYAGCSLCRGWNGRHVALYLGCDWYGAYVERYFRLRLVWLAASGL